MSATDLEEFYVHTVTVEMYLGQNGYGEDQFAAPVDIIGWMDGTRRLVRDKDGQQIVSESLFCTYPVNAPLFVADSRVTYGGVAARVIRTNSLDSGALDLPDHVEVTLT
jgi:hypothetical protein